MGNNRIFYAGQGLAIKNNGGALTWNTGHLAHGVQSLGMTTNINLTPIFELGNVSLYENTEGLPDVECTAQKVLDGSPLLYHLATVGAASSPTLVGRSSARCDVGVAVYPDTSDFASGTPVAIAALSGMYVNSISYSFASDGSPFTEDLTLVGNDKIWSVGGVTPNYGEVDMTTMPTLTWNAHMRQVDVPLAIQGIQQSQEFNFDLPTTGYPTGPVSADINGAVNHPDCTVFPSEIQGFTRSGTRTPDAHVASVKVSSSFNRETINQLGDRGPYSRTIKFPVEVTSEFTLTASTGDMFTVIQRGALGTGSGSCSSDNSNVRNRTIRLVICDGVRIYLGVKNKLASVNYGGGDAGGGNVQITYNYTNNNDFTVMASYDPHASGSTWWTNRQTYLTT